MLVRAFEVKVNIKTKAMKLIRATIVNDVGIVIDPGGWKIKSRVAYLGYERSV